MNDNKFDAPEPIFDNEDYEDQGQPPVDTEGMGDIGQAGSALTIGTRISLGSIWSSIGGMTGAGGKLYLRGWISATSSNFQRNIRRYTTSGTLETAGNINGFTAPSRPTGVPNSANNYARNSNEGIWGLSHYNNEFYVLRSWQKATSPSGTWWNLVKYNSTFTTQSSVFVLGDGETFQSYTDFDIYDNKVYLLLSGSPTDTIEIRNLSNGTLASGTNTISVARNSNNSAFNKIAVSASRIYVLATSSGGTPDIRVYNHLGTDQTAEGTEFPLMRGTPSSVTILGTTLYLTGLYGRQHSLWPLTGVPAAAVSAEVANATWGTPAYCTTSGKLEATLTFDKDVTGIAAADFRVQERSGTAPDYVWTDVSWTFDTPSATAAANTGISIKAAVPANTNKVVRFRLRQTTVLGPNAQSPNSPMADADSSEVTINNVVAYSATWGPIAYTSDTRVMSATLTLSEDPGSAFNVDSDFDVEKRSGPDGSYTWATDTNWGLRFTGTGTSRVIIATPNQMVTAGVYRITLAQNAFGSGKPTGDVSSDGQIVGAYVAPPTYSASFASGSPSGDRTIEFVLTLTEDPGSAFDASADFSMQIRSGTSPDYVWGPTTGWTITGSGSGTSRTMRAVPAQSVLAGTYRMALAEDAFGMDKPDMPVYSNAFQIGAYVVPTSLDGNDQFRLTIPLPMNSRGSIQVSVKPRTFNIDGEADQLGPANQQYLGTIDYDNSTIPYIVNREYPPVLERSATTMDIGIDFDQEVKGVDSDSFEIEPSTVRLIDSNVFSAVTPNPDVRPAVSARTIASTRATRAKYWRLRLILPDPHPMGVIGIWAKADTINND